MAYGAILGQRFDGYTREETLTDQTKLMLGLPSDSTPDDAFQALYLTSTGGNVFSLTVLYPDGSPWAGLALSGVTNLQGGPATTDSEGKALVSSQSSNPTVTGANDYIDINPINQQLSKDSSIITYVTIQTTTNNANVNKMVQVTSNTSFKVSKFITRMDVGLCGGGGGGDGAGSRAGGGGGDGWITTRANIQPSVYGDTINITIGKGGNPGNNSEDYNFDNYLLFAGEDGGDTVFAITGNTGLTLTAQGGQGGGKVIINKGEYNTEISRGGNGNGGKQSGGDGAYYPGSMSSAISPTSGSYGGYLLIGGEQINCGGGGGGGTDSYLGGNNSGGYPYGGRGYKYYGDTSDDTKATGTGGGGGGGFGNDTAGRGGDGIAVYILYTN